MPEIKSVIVITANPSGGRDDLGSCEEGFYTLDGDVLTMVTATGQPLRGTFGERLPEPWRRRMACRRAIHHAPSL
jgi:hypothetical protein